MARSDLLTRYARIGAESRLVELKAEIAEIERAFPDLGGRRGPGRPRAAEAPARRARKPMTAAQKKAVGERMKKYWAERRKADGEKKR